jgi:hypothetical protein
MNSVQDLPKEGLPHSDICGSTNARFSPQLIAACHVLHRLLVPRHPPNALLILILHRPHAGPKRAFQHIGPAPDRSSNFRDASSCKEVSPAGHSISPIQIHHEKQHGHPGSHPSREKRLTRRVFRKLIHSMETVGIEPTAPCLQSRRSPAELRPQGLLSLPAQTRQKARMGQGGLEPPTPRLSSVCSNQLSYWPKQVPGISPETEIQATHRKPRPGQV